MKSIDKFSPNFLYRAYNPHAKAWVTNNNQYDVWLDNL